MYHRDQDVVHSSFSCACSLLTFEQVALAPTATGLILHMHYINQEHVCTGPVVLLFFFVEKFIYQFIET